MLPFILLVDVLETFKHVLLDYVLALRTRHTERLKQCLHLVNEGDAMSKEYAYKLEVLQSVC